MIKLSDEWQTPQWLWDELSKEFNFDIDLCATKENSKCKTYCIDYLNDEAELGDFQEAINPLYREIHTPQIRTAFMNPPYSKPKPFIEKAWEDSKHCKIVLLVKCDPSTKWWATFWNYKEIRKDVEMLVKGPIHDNITDKGVHCSYYSRETQNKIIEQIGPKPGCEVRFFPKRIKFDPPQQLINSGEVELINNQWFKVETMRNTDPGYRNIEEKIYTKLSGPTFPCALVIMDRRGL